MNAALIDDVLPDGRLAPEFLSNGRMIRVARAVSRRRPTIVRPEPADRTKERDSALIYARNRLLAWSHWAKEHRQELGYPTISVLYRAMRATKVGIVRGTAYPQADEHGDVHYPISADGTGTRSFRPPTIGEVPEELAEVDRVVARVPPKPREVGIVHYFTYGPIEERVKRTKYRRARYLQMLEVFEYSVFIGLQMADIE